jgi:nicotinamide N-methyltransferase
LKIRERCTVSGFLWGDDPSALIDKADVIILSDLVFNHSQHRYLLKTCKDVLADDGVAYCVFTHHRPWMAHKDLDIFRLATEEFGFNVEKVDSILYGPMFEEDPGDVKVRSTIHFYKITYVE